MKNEQFIITGMTCTSCSANITKQVQKLNGVENVNVSLLANKMSVTYDESETDSSKIISAVVSAGYGASSSESDTQQKSGFRSQWQTRRKAEKEIQQNMKKRLVSSVLLLIPLMYISMGHMLGIRMPDIFATTEYAIVSALLQLLITIPVVYVNRHFFISGGRALIKRAPNMDSLVATGSLAALVYGIFSLLYMSYAAGHGDMATLKHYSHELYFESCAMILTLVTVGKYLETISKSKTSDALGKLIDLAPKTATVIRAGVQQIIPAEQVVTDDIVVVKPGTSIPVDGVVTQGYGYVDQSAITGESIPVEKNPGDNVISATINKNGTFHFRASKVGDNTTLAGIIRLVDEAGNSKAPIARLADRISGIFVPVVIALSLITAAVWLISGQSFDFALSRCISVLVISCPCALGLATPVAIMAGTGKAAEYGILIKSAESLENLHCVDTVVLDKTGTITSGNPSVTDIIVIEPDITENDLLTIAASLEAESEHPLANAVVNEAKKQNIEIKPVAMFTVHSGLGVSADFKGKPCYAGNLRFMMDNIPLNSNVKETISHITNKFSDEGKTPLIFGSDNRIYGIIAVADTIREASREALKNLKDLGIETVVLTGDNKATADTVCKSLDINRVIADAMPQQKEEHVRNLIEQGHVTAMVGDGINDAPALVRANVGIAIGAGTDIAIDSADIVLMKSSLNDVVTAILLSKSVVRNIKINLFWAFFYNVLGIPLAAGILYPEFGITLSPMVGAAAMSLSSLCVVSNALRLRYFKEKVYNTNSENKEMSDKKEKIDMTRTLTVDGMQCAHCKKRVEDAVSAIDGVESACADLESKKVTVVLSNDISDDVISSAITNAGYTVL